MTEDRFRDLEVRLRKVEDFILSQLNMLLELSQSMKGRIEVLEEHDVEFTRMVNQTCDIKSKEILKAKEDSIEYTDTIHKQTWVVIAGMFTLFIGAVLYFNLQVNDRAIASQKNSTNIENITRTLDKIDSKLDKISDTVKDDK